MVSDDLYDRSRVHEGVVVFFGVVVEDCAAGRVPPVDGVTCCRIRSRSYGLVELTVY